MKETITLLDVCRLPDVQIHSKTALFKQIVNKETPEMQKIRDNIVKLSYTTKTIGVKDEEIGIFSKRLPLKFKSSSNKILSLKSKTDNIVNQKYLPHKTFFTAPLATVKKNQEEERQQTVDYPRKQILNNGINNQYSFQPTTRFKPRTQSMARLRMYQTGKGEKQIQVQKRSNPAYNIHKNRKSYSGLLRQLDDNKGVKKAMVMTPLKNEENGLFQKIKKISGARKIEDEDDYNEISEELTSGKYEQSQFKNK